MLAAPSSHVVNAQDGTLENPSRTYEKKLGDLVGLYADADAFAKVAETDGGRIVYKVQDRHPQQDQGDLIFGITLMGEDLPAQLFTALALVLLGIFISQSRAILAALRR